MEAYFNDNFGGVKPKQSPEEALQRWRKACEVVKNPKRRFRYTANLSKRNEAEAMRRANLAKLKAALRVSNAASLSINNMNLSRVPEEENAAGFQIYADEMDSTGITDQMVTVDNLNTANAIARKCGILTGKGLAIKGAEFQEKIEQKLRELIPAMQAVLQYIWLILMRFAIWLTIVVRRTGGQVLMFGKILFSFWVKAPSSSQLPNDLISTVVNRLTTIEDFTASSQVCHNWRSVCVSMNWTPGPQPPWLMLSENPISNRRRFFSLYNNLCYELELPTGRGRCCYGTAQGCIIAVGPDLQAHLLHPLHQVKIDLPALPNQVGVPTDWFNYIQKFIAFKNSHDQFVVMAIYGPSSWLAFAKPGDSEWVILRDHCDFKDVTYFKSRYYALCGRGVLKSCEESELSGPHSEVCFEDFPPRDLERTDKMYLVESSGNLYAVFRYGSADVSDECYKSESFKVCKYQFNLSDDPPLPGWATVPAWERVTDLEDFAFFVGNGNSWSICASNIVNCKKNCIYFTDDNWRQQNTIGGTYGGHDIGVFDMATKKIEYLNFGVDTPSDYSRPIWFGPTFQHNEGSRPIWLTPTLPQKVGCSKVPAVESSFGGAG